MPSVDHTMGVDYRHADGGSQTTGRYTTFLTGDLLWMESAMFLTGTDQDASPDFRITLGRNDPDARLLGPLRARAFAFGSVAVPGLENVARTSPTGNGLMLSNAPLTQPLSFGRHSLQGDLPPGWDVELYLNDALIGFQQSRSDGKYTFDDVPLVYGNNEFRLVFHGPQGQTRVERQGFLLEQSLVRPGEFYYRVAAHDDQDGNRRSIAQFDLGLGRNLSATGGVVTLPLLNEQRDYSNVGLRAQWRSLFFNSDMVWTEGGSLAELGLRTQVGSLRVGLSRAQLMKDFVSEEFLPSTDPVLTRDRLRFDWPIPLYSTLRLPVTLETKRDHLRSGLNNVESSLRISGYFWRTAVTNQLRWQSIGGVESSDGSLQVSSRFGSLGVRGLAAYNLSGEKGFTAVALAADKRLAHGYLVNADITRSLTTPPETRYGVGLTKSVGAFGLRISAGYSSREEAIVSAELFLSLAREPREPGWVFDALPQADSGAISARVFLDKNFNGVMDQPDEPIKDAAFTVNGGRHPVRTDANGIAYLSRLPVKQHADIGIDASTLEDPQWSPREKGARLVPRPGKVAMLDFPVILTSEIDGTVFVLDEKGKRGIGNIVLELMDENFNVVGQATSASDGFYIVTAVPPGKYLLRIPRGQLKPLGLTDTGTHIISVPPDGEFVNGIDFIVIPDWENVRARIQPPRLAPKAVEPARVEPRTITVPVPAPRTSPRYYTVKKGDWLWKIARLFYGEATKANVDKILAINRDLIRNPAALQPGQKIRIPPDAP
jgi:hypothetical protein